MSILVTLCTYNEVDNLRELLPLLLALHQTSTYWSSTTILPMAQDSLSNSSAAANRACMYCIDPANSASALL